MRKLFGRDVSGEDGASLVEFSLVTVVFIVLLLSVVEMGRMILVYTALANAARAGTRYAIVHGSDSSTASGPGNTSAVQTVVSNFAAAGLLNTSKLNTTVSYPGTNKSGQVVTVTVTYTYDPMVGYFNSILNKNLGSTSEGVIVF